jgi:hypothetical protein
MFPAHSDNLRWLFTPRFKVAGPRHGGEISVELVVSFREQIAIRIGEGAGKFGHQLIEFCSCLTSCRSTMEHDREREIAKRLTVTQGAQAIAKILDVSLLGLIDQHIARVSLARVVAHPRHKPCLPWNLQK